MVLTGLSAEVRPSYGGVVRQFEAWLGGQGAGVRSVTPALGRLYLESLRSIGTRRKHLSVLRQVFRGLVTADTLRWNPFDGLAVPSRSGESASVPWSAALVSRDDSVRDARDRAMVACVRYTFFSLEEIAGLKMTDFRREDALLRSGGRAGRCMPLHPRLAESLDALRSGSEAVAPSTPMFGSLGRGHWRGDSIKATPLTRTNVRDVVLRRLQRHSGWLEWPGVSRARSSCFASLSGPRWTAGP